MIRFLPEFICRQYKEKKHRGKFRAVSLFIDMTGFTSISDRLSKYGKEGEEALSEIINIVFEPAIDSIYIHNGFITGFAGDAFTAVFPEDDPINAIIASYEISQTFSGLALDTIHENFSVGAKIGLSTGNVEWGIIENPLQNTYYFKGDAINGAVHAQRHSKMNRVIIDTRLRKRLKTGIKLKEVSKGYYQVKEVDLSRSKIGTLNAFSPDRELLKRFVPEEIMDMKGMGEFREVVPVFVNFRPEKNPEDFINAIIEKTFQYGGYFNKVDFGDKGGIILVLFGAPRARENQTKRAVEFSMDVLNTAKHTNARIGISVGTVYAGILGSNIRGEYSVLGKMVNLSARLATYGEWGKILVESHVFNQLKNIMLIEEKKAIKLKGFRKKTEVYVPLKIITARSPVGKYTFVGREDDLLKLKEFIEPIFKGKFSGVIYVDGEAGIGKSVLIEELHQSLCKRINYFYMPADDVKQTGFFPVVQFLKNYFKQDDEMGMEENKKRFDEVYSHLSDLAEDPEIKKTLNIGKPLIAELLGIEYPRTSRLTPKAKYNNTLFTLKNIVKLESRVKPTLVVFEDLQWIDDSTKDFIRLLVRNVEGFPFGVIITGRPDSKGTPLRISGLDVPQKHINLAGLNLVASTRIVHNIVGTEPSTELAKVIFEKSEGNPFYVEMITKYLKENGYIVKKRGKATLRSKTFDIPGTINSIIAARIDKLDRDLKETVKIASVLGREFSIRVLSAMLADRPVEKMILKGIEEDIWRSMSELKYIFKHAIIRDTVYNMQLKRILRELHRLAGETIEKLFKNNLNPYLGELAYHYENAGNVKKAKMYLKKAGKKASKDYRLNEALDYYLRLRKFVNGKERLNISLEIASLKSYIGKWNESVEELKQVIKDGEKIGYKKAVATAKVSLGTIYDKMGRYKDSVKLLEEARRMFEDMDDKVGLASAFVRLGVVKRDEGNTKLSIKLTNEGLKYARETKKHPVEHHALMNLGHIYFDMGDYKKAIHYYEESLKVAKKHRQKGNIAHSLGNLGNAYWAFRQLDMALKLYNQALSISSAIGDVYSMAIAWLNIGMIFQELGKLDKAEESVLKAIELLREIGDKVDECNALGTLGHICIEIGAFKKAKKLLEKQLRMAESIKDVFYTTVSLYYNGVLHKEMGEYKKALEFLNRGTEIGRKHGLLHIYASCLSEKVEILIDTGEMEEADSLLEKLKELNKKLHVPTIVLRTLILEARLMAANDKDAAEEYLKDKREKLSKQESQFLPYIDLEIYRINKDPSLRKKLIKTFIQMNEETPRYAIKKILEELKGSTVNDASRKKD